MKKTLTLTAGIIGVAAVLDLIFGVFEKPKEIRKINVSGECLTSVPKDRTAITLRVTTLDKNAAVLLFAVVQEQLKKLIGQLAIRPLKEAEETENK